MGVAAPATPKSKMTAASSSIWVVALGSALDLCNHECGSARSRQMLEELKAHPEEVPPVPPAACEELPKNFAYKGRWADLQEDADD